MVGMVEDIMSMKLSIYFLFKHLGGQSGRKLQIHSFG